MFARRLVVVCLLFTSAAVAQAQTSRSAQPTSLKRTVSPSFRIEPVVHRFKSRRGEVVPFTFEIGSLGRDMEVEVKLVNLRQQESGVILHDPTGAVPEDVKLLTPATFKLAPGETKEINGRLTTPIAKTNYLSYGLLVREVGQNPEYEDTDDRSVKAGVRFVTQYVLRVDVETGVAGIGDIKHLRLENAAIVPSNGLPVARTYLNNPTNFAFECFVTASLQSPTARRGIVTKLGMPSRSGLEGDERHLVRVMPHSRLRLEAPIEQTLELGQQQLTIDLASSRRKILSSSYEVAIHADDYPALASRRAVLASGVTVSPSQLELGLARNSKRTETLEFRNTSGEAIEIALAPRTFAGQPIEGIRFSPATFSLKPGRTRKVRAMLRGGAATTAESGAAHVTVATASEQATRALPLSVLMTEPDEPRLDLSPIEWKLVNNHGVFVVSVANDSQDYVPLEATLAIQSRSGKRQQLQAGFGNWLAPGRSTELVFHPEQPIVSDEYALGLQIKTRDGVQPITRTLRVTLTSSEATADARKTSNQTSAG